MNNYPRLLIAGASSGCGKTMICCGLLQAFSDRGLKAASFKCGPDYIDPVFHRIVTGRESVNLDSFFSDEETIRYLLGRHAEDADLSLIEGVMGYYDGLGGLQVRASSYDIARITGSSSILILDCRGMSLSAAAMAMGYVHFRKDSHIRGLILNRVSPMLYPGLKKEIESAVPELKLLGYVPKCEEMQIKSRHLGLAIPEEGEEMRKKIRLFANELEKSLDLDGMLELARSSDPLIYSFPFLKGNIVKENRAEEGKIKEDRTKENKAGKGETKEDQIEERSFEEVKTKEDRAKESKVEESIIEGYKTGDGKAEAAGARKLRIAVSNDEAFCFHYVDNLELLESLGAEIIPFSPLRDSRLPDDICGLILCGGYPELYAGRLSGNSDMIRALRSAIQGGMPTMAECGGFLYLMDQLEDMEGHPWPMLGILQGRAWKTDRLGHFGYISLKPRAQIMQSDSDRRKDPSDPSAVQEVLSDRRIPGACTFAGSKSLEERLSEAAVSDIRGHEFHYYDTSDNGDAFLAVKAAGGRSWPCMHLKDNLLAGFPHLYYYSEPRLPETFLSCCRDYRSMKAADAQVQTHEGSRCAGTDP